MIIETKFNIGDTIYFISIGNLKVNNSTVQGIKILITEDHEQDELIYLCNQDKGERVHLKVHDKDAFASKEALLKSL